MKKYININRTVKRVVLLTYDSRNGILYRLFDDNTWDMLSKNAREEVNKHLAKGDKVIETF